MKMLDGLLTRWERDAEMTLLDVARNWQDGGIKLLLTALLLKLRGRHESLVLGEYLPCEVQGTGDIGAFLRRSAQSAVLVVFRRFPFAAAKSRAQPLRLSLPAELARWRDVLRGQSGVAAASLSMHAELPVAVFEWEAPSA